MQKIKITDRREIHVQAKKWRGKDVVDIRTYVITEGYTGYTRKGINIDKEHAVEVAKAILKECGGEDDSGSETLQATDQSG